MGRMDDGFVDLTVTSPPYDNLRDYNGYSFDFPAISKELFRVTKDGGVVVWIVADATINGSETGTSFRQALGFMDVGFRLHDTMIWHKTNPMPTQHNRYENSHEFMFVMSKGRPRKTSIIKEATTSNPSISRKHRAVKGNKDAPNDEGFYRTKPSKIKHNVWDVLVGQKTTKHPAPFPEALARDHIISWSNPGDLVYDPFLGSGTTAKMAYQLDREFIGSEISREYVELANKRLKPVLDQGLLYR